MSCTKTSPRMNLKPEFWGPYAWMFLYSVALGYPNTPTAQDRASIRQLFSSLGPILPCERCRLNYYEKMDGPLGRQLEAATDCSEKLVKFVYDLESAVAVKNGKTPEDMDTVIRRVMGDTYVKKSNNTSSAVASTEEDVGGGKSMPTILWGVVLPIGIILACLVTWLVTYKVLRKKRVLLL